MGTVITRSQRCRDFSCPPTTTAFRALSKSFYTLCRHGAPYLARGDIKIPLQSYQLIHSVSNCRHLTTLPIQNALERLSSWLAILIRKTYLHSITPPSTSISLQGLSELSDGMPQNQWSLPRVVELVCISCIFIEKAVSHLSTPVRRHISASSLEPATPTSDFVELTISTPPPSPPASLLPIHARVRALLRSTCNNTSASIAGRDTERNSLVEFLTSFINGTSMDHNLDATSMFISGAPGTGKTALVNTVIRDLSAKNDHVKVISINCMALKSVDALWERIIEDLAIAPKKKSSVNRKTNGHDMLKTLLSTLDTQW